MIVETPELKEIIATNSNLIVSYLIKHTNRKTIRVMKSKPLPMPGKVIDRQMKREKKMVGREKIRSYELCLPNFDQIPMSFPRIYPLQKNFPINDL